jgi:type IV pilus assembly protein PilA
MAITYKILIQGCQRCTTWRGLELVRDTPSSHPATRSMIRDRKGFTLIELLVVIVIIGLLAAIAIPKFSSVKQRAYRSQGIADLGSLRVAEESFFVDSSRYGTIAEVGNRFSSTTGVGTPTIAPTLTYWSATLIHPQIPGMTCGIAVATTNPVDATAGEGEPVCK